jgi:hypothetical protein
MPLVSSWDGMAWHNPLTRKTRNFHPCSLGVGDWINPIQEGSTDDDANRNPTIALSKIVGTHNFIVHTSFESESHSLQPRMVSRSTTTQNFPNFWVDSDFFRKGQFSPQTLVAVGRYYASGRVSGTVVGVGGWGGGVSFGSRGVRVERTEF